MTTQLEEATTAFQADAETLRVSTETLRAQYDAMVERTRKEAEQVGAWAWICRRGRRTFDSGCSCFSRTC